MKRVVLLAILACLSPFCTAQQATVDLRGLVTDSSGAALAGATVTAINENTELQRSAQTLETGAYAIAALPAGGYRIKVTKDGFSTKELHGIVLTVGETAAYNVTLEIGAVTESVSVASVNTGVDTQESFIGKTIDQKSVQDLPLQSRQFANLAVLTPGVTLQYNGDPTEANREMPSIAGGRARFTSFNIDNADDSEDLDGGLLYTLSLDAIQEFQVITHRFTAEQGRAAYGIINVITKSGSNQFHGSGFEYFRNQDLNARTHTEELNDDPKGAYLRNQYGGSLGGPILRDKLFFFGAVERLAQNTVNTINTQGIAPSLDGPENLPQTLLTITGKVDARISQNHQMSVRLSRETNAAAYGASTLTPTESQGFNKNAYNAGVINLTSMLGPSRVNQMTFDVTSWENSLAPNSTLPTLFFPNGVTLGEGTAFPQTTSLKKFQFRDTLALQATGHGTHNIKVGVEYVLTPHASGTYNTQVTPQYYFLGNSTSSPIDEIFYNIGNGVFQANNFQRIGAFAQDDWQINPKLTLNLGLRWDYYGGVAFNQNYSPTFTFLQTVLPSYAGKQAHTPGTDFGPRLGFAYDPHGTGKTVIRGGYGYYFNFPVLTTFYTLLDRNPDPLRMGYYVDVPSGITNADGSYYQYGQPLPANQLQPTALPLPASVVDPNNVDPRYQHATLGFQHALGSHTTIGADALWSKGDHAALANEINRYNEYAAMGFNFPIRTETTQGKNAYKAINISVVQHYSKNLQLNAWYTYSRCWTTGVRASDDGFSNFPINENDPAGREDYGPCALSPAHKLMVSPVWSLPHQIQLSSITRYASSQRYNITAGIDLNGDGVNNDLPAGVPYINYGTGAKFFQSDLRAAKFFTLPEHWGSIEGDFELYNIFNNINPSTYIGNQQASNYGQPTAFSGDPLQGEQRLIQLGARYSF
jgi:outer membrane receptor protein involved in Fe transport